MEQMPNEVPVPTVFACEPIIDYGDAPLVLIAADSPAGIARCCTAIAAAGGRSGPARAFDEAADALDPAPTARAVLIDIEGAESDALATLLTRLECAARSGLCGGVVRLPPGLIDFAMAHAPHPDIHLLSDSSAIEEAATLALVLHRPAAMTVRESPGEAPQLRQLSEEVSRIARALAALSNGIAPLPPGTAPETPPDPAPLPPIAAVRALIRARRLRDGLFAGDLFADPAWDMLLDLFAARIERRAVAVSSLCIASAVPPTTALRWIKRLTDEGVFLRTADPQDGRRVFIALSEQAAEAMRGYFGAIGKAGVSLG